MKRATIKDVAKASNVSISTVSRVINGNYPISEEVRERVQKAVEELKYHVNPVASSLKSKKSFLVGMVISRYTNSVIMEIVQVIEKALEKHGYTLMVASSENNPYAEEKILRSFTGRMVDAVISITSFTESYHFVPFIEAGIPVILVDRCIKGAPFDSVSEDNMNATYQVICDFISKGHKRIALFKGDDFVASGYERYQGYLKALNEAGIAIRDDYVINAHFGRTEAAHMMKDMIKSMKPEELPTAIFACNVLMAEGILTALNESGLKVPEDISLASYGQMSIPEYYHPKIAHIRQNTSEIGEKTSELVIKRLINNTEEEAIRILVESYFDEGESISRI